MSRPTLLMIPCPIVDGKVETLPQETLSELKGTTVFVVERARTARRFIKSIGHDLQIAELQIFELDKNNPGIGLSTFLSAHQDSKYIGVLSEAGCPGIADPGHLAVAYAHQNGWNVKPLVGPSSIFLALMASGLNGQNFAFNGYLPNKSGLLNKKLKALEALVFKQNQTQIFMDAPYRNKFLLEHCIRVFEKSLSLTVACDIGAPTEFIKTKRISEWQKHDLDQFHKRPAIILVGRIL